MNEVSFSSLAVIDATSELDLNETEPINDEGTEQEAGEPVDIDAEVDAEVATLPGNDPFTVNEEGRFVGIDGFIVPDSFAEFFERFPHYVRSVVRSSPLYGTNADKEDWEQDCLTHLQSIPENSPLRAPGYNHRANGCTDRIQTFDPTRGHGASMPRFLYWLRNTVLRRYLCSIARKRHSDPLGKIDTNVAGLAKFDDGESAEQFTPDVAIAINRHHQDMKGNEQDLDYTASYFDSPERVVMLVTIQKFSRYVEHYNPELIPIIEVLGRADTYTEAQQMLGMTEKTLLRARARLRELHRCFMSKGTEEPTRQRRAHFHCFCKGEGS